MASDQAESESDPSPQTHTFRFVDRSKWREALRSPRPVLIHLNGDTTWLIQLPYPATAPGRPGRSRFNILIDPWLRGPQSDVASWFSTQWHVVPASVENLDDLSNVLLELEGGESSGETCCIDAVVVSHEFTDHCHEATLRQLPSSTPVVATDKAAALIRSWSHFDSVTTAPGFLVESSSGWRAAIGNAGLPDWVGIGRIVTPGNSLYYHSAVIVAFDLSEGGDGSDREMSKTQAESILYSPHGIKASDLSRIQDSGVKTLALLHGLHDVGIWMTKQLNLGALNGIRAVAESGAKYWVATHDEVKTGGGLIAPFLWRTRYTLGQAVEAETTRMSEVPDFEFMELGSGDAVVLT